MPSRTHEWRKALISSVRAWLGQALTIEDAVVSRSAFPITELLLFLYCPNFFFSRIALSFSSEIIFLTRIESIFFYVYLCNV